MNLVDYRQARLFTEKEFKKLFDDILYECSKKGEFKHLFVVKNSNCKIGAEPGSVFVITESKDKSLEVD